MSVEFRVSCIDIADLFGPLLDESCGSVTLKRGTISPATFGTATRGKTSFAATHSARDFDCERPVVSTPASSARCAVVRKVDLSTGCTPRPTRHRLPE